VVIALTTDLVIIGTGGQGRECLDIVRAMNDEGCTFNFVGFVDDNPSDINRSHVEGLGHEVLGTLEELLKSPKSAQVCIGIGNGGARRRISARLDEANIGSPVLVHPSSSLGSNVKIGPGSAIWAGARLTTNIRLGRHVHVNQNATVGHDSVLGDYSTLNPLAAVSGNVDLGAGCTVGAGAVVLQGRKVGSDAMVGASACVTADVDEDAVVVGVPARRRSTESEEVGA
jgi:sugar O-acyltransferase (sialic acid O-acetyltransferase NeuD family)